MKNKYSVLTNITCYVVVWVFWAVFIPAGGGCPIWAEVYMYIDDQGIIHFTNTPTSSDERLFIKEPLEPLHGSRMPKKYDKLIRKAAHQHKIAFGLLKAMIKVESDFDPYAVSRTGAKGLMQIMPDNIAAFGIKNAFDPKENIMGGTKYFRQLLDIFKHNVPLALAAYNAGPNAVQRYQRIPPFQETEAFVNRVMTYYHLLKFDQ